MSGHHIAQLGHQRSLSRGLSKDFTVATPEAFVKRFGGDRVINKVHFVCTVIEIVSWFVAGYQATHMLWAFFILCGCISRHSNHVWMFIGSRTEGFKCMLATLGAAPWWVCLSIWAAEVGHIDRQTHTDRHQSDALCSPLFIWSRLGCHR